METDGLLNAPAAVPPRK